MVEFVAKTMTKIFKSSTKASVNGCMLEVNETEAESSLNCCDMSTNVTVSFIAAAATPSLLKSNNCERSIATIMLLDTPTTLQMTHNALHSAQTKYIVRLVPLSSRNASKQYAMKIMLIVNMIDSMGYKTKKAARHCAAAAPMENTCSIGELFRSLASKNEVKYCKFAAHAKAPVTLSKMTMPRNHPDDINASCELRTLCVRCLLLRTIMAAHKTAHKQNPQTYVLLEEDRRMYVGNLTVTMLDARVMSRST